jgi:hypothetical protein
LKILDLWSVEMKNSTEKTQRSLLDWHSRSMQFVSYIRLYAICNNIVAPGGLLFKITFAQSKLAPSPSLVVHAGNNFVDPSKRLLLRSEQTSVRSSSWYAGSLRRRPLRPSRRGQKLTKRRTLLQYESVVPFTSLA